MVRRNVHWRLLLLLDAHHGLFQRPVVCDSIHGENMLYADAYSDAATTERDADANRNLNSNAFNGYSDATASNPYS